MNWQIFPIWHSSENIISLPVIKVKRVYDKPLKGDGYRVYVDRHLPYNLTQTDAAINEWLKELAPSESLSNWFDHDPFRWEEFKRRYKAELRRNSAAAAFAGEHKNTKLLTMVYKTAYDKMTHALVLQQYLETIFMQYK